jgi:D-glycero-D-manno-heptose 1,7-bisphosphate phosphatase
MRDRVAVLLDRDGVINRRLEAGVRCVADFAFVPRALEALALLNRFDAIVAVISNQANIGRQFLTFEELQCIHAAMLERIRASGGRVDAVYFCPHTAAVGCSCRKPAPGMLLRASADLKFALESAFMVGDQECDVEAARRAGCHPILIGEGGSAPMPWPVAPPVAEDLFAAVESIVADASHNDAPPQVRASVEGAW